MGVACSAFTSPACERHPISGDASINAVNGWRWAGRSVVVGVLERADMGEVGIVRRVLLRAASGKLREAVHEGKLALAAELDVRRDHGGVIEGADAERRTIGRLVGQRRAATRAEAALHDVGRAKPVRLARRPAQRGGVHRDERREEGAERLLVDFTCGGLGLTYCFH